MPRLNIHGEWCSGIAGAGTYWGTVNANDKTILSGQISESGGAAWLSDNEVITQRFNNGHARLAAINIRNNTTRDIIDASITEVSGSGYGHWVIFVPGGVQDYAGRFHVDSSTVKTALGPDGSYALKVKYFSFGPWDIIFANGNRRQFTAGDAHTIKNYGGGLLSWIENGIARAIGLPDNLQPQPISTPFWWLRLIEINGMWWQLYQTEQGSVFHPIGDINGHKITVDNFYNPDIIRLPNGHVRIVWAITEGEVPNDVRVKTFDPMIGRIPLTQASTPMGEPMIRAFERPMWQAPYFSHHVRYGDTEPSKHVGNAIAVIGDDNNFERFNDLHMPLIVDINVPNPTFNPNLTVAWLVHGGPIDETIQNSNNALSLPEKPIIAYNDGREWPSSDPFTNDRIWPSIQAYRGPSEPLDSFGMTLTAIIERVSRYNRPMCLVPRFDDFNGSSTIERTLECMHLYEQWLREFNFVACMPFSDRRGNGISKNKSLWDWARAFQYAIPFERPNRFDYWRPSSSSIISILNNKFGQTRASIVLEPYLRADILSRYSNSEPEPEPEPGDIEGVENGMVVNPEKFFMSLVRNKRPQDFELVMREIEKIFYKYGFGHQCRSDCVPRGRIFMPHASARNVAPDISIEREKCLGVTQRIGSAAWAHQVNIVNHPPTQWVWDDMGGPEYVPYKPV